MKIKILDLNNKSRKGTYVYLKEGKARGAYFKFSEGERIDFYKQYYVDRYVKKKPKGTLKEYKETYKARLEKRRWKTTPLRRQADRYLKKVKARPSLDEAISKGITQAVIADAKTAKYKDVNKAVQDALRDLVLDKQLLRIIAEEENCKKMINRFEHRVSFRDDKGKVIGNSGAFDKTPYQVVAELQKAVGYNEEVIGLRTPQLARKLEHYKFTKYNHEMDGKIKTTKVLIIFRKGK